MPGHPQVSSLDPDIQAGEGVAEYRVANWPAISLGKRWREVTQDRDVPAAWAGREPIFPWEAKVYAAV